MNCDDRRELLIAYSLGQLEPDAAAQLRAHLEQGCHRCNGALQEIREAWGELSVWLDPVQPDKRIEETLFARIGQRAHSRTVAVESAQPFSSDIVRLRPRMLALMALAAMLMGVAAYSLCIQFLPIGNQAVQQVPDRWGAGGNGGNSVRPVVLLPKNMVDQPAVRVIWDMEANQWHFFAHRLAPTDPDFCYQLWFEGASGAYTSAATFPVDESGAGGVVVDLPDDAQQITGVLLTLETSDGAPQPTGPVQFSASVKFPE